MNSRFSTRKLALLGVMTAFVFASNYARIVMPIAIGGTTAFTLANILCCMSGLILGPVGGLAAGLGSAIYDLTFPAYAAECWITFINKGAMGLVAGLIYQAMGHKRGGLILSGIPSELIMVFGYFAFEAALMGQGLGAAVGIPANFVQAAFGLVAATLLTEALRRNSYVRKTYPAL